MDALPRDILEPVQLDAPVLDLRLQRLLEAFALEFDVERRQPARRRDHAEHAQRGGDREGRGECGRGHVPHERILAAEVALRLGVVQRLPRQGGEPRGGQPQGDLHALTALGRDGHARAVGAGDAAGERGLEEPPADVLDRGLGVRHHPARRNRRRQDVRLELWPTVQQVVEIEAEGLAGLPAADRLEHAHHERARVGTGPDLQLHHRVHARIFVGRRSHATVAPLISRCGRVLNRDALADVRSIHRVLPNPGSRMPQAAAATALCSSSASTPYRPNAAADVGEAARSTPRATA